MVSVRLTAEDRHFLTEVLKPSWLSGLVIICAGLIVSIGSIITFSLSHSSFKQELLSWQQSRTHAALPLIGQSTQTVNPTIQNTWPLILLWALVGLVIYVIAASIVRLILQIIEFRKELDYVHANRRSMVRTTVEHIFMRLIAAILLISLGLLFIDRILPFAVSESSTAQAHLLSVHGGWFAFASFALTALTFYVGSVLLRLTFGKSRITSLK